MFLKKDQKSPQKGGLNLKKNKKLIRDFLKKFRAYKIRTSLFIEPNISDIKVAKELNANCVEIHTGKFCNLLNKKKAFIMNLIDLKKLLIMQMLLD